MISPKLHTIVCLEDDFDLARLIKVSLDSTSTIVHLAHDGVQGLKLIRYHEPDLILLDLNLPGLNGWDISNTVKSDPLLCHIPIVVLTAIPRESQLSHHLGPVDAYLLKPFSINQLRDALRAVFPPLILPFSPQYPY